MPAKKAAGKAAAIERMKLERQKRLEEEERRKKEEEEARQAEEEEEKKREQEEEERKAAKAKAKAEKEKSVKEGKSLSKKDQEKQDANRRKLEQLRASGMVIPEALLRKLEGGGEETTEAKPKKKGGFVAASKKPKKPQPKKVEEEVVEEVEAEPEPAEEEDDWEAEAERQEAEEKAAAEARAKAAELQAKAEAAAELAGAPDSWEDEDDEEDGAAPVEPAAPTPAPAPAEKKPAASPPAPKSKKGAHADPAPDSPDKKKEDAHRELRSPICTVMGHVDTGKTKILDCIRRTKVQSGEAGGITQQIGASFLPIDAIVAKTKELQEHSKSKMSLELPGLLVIDTPGHEAFENLRARGSSLCDIAILVVDIMHGLEPQTLSSMAMLSKKKVPFVVALNKIDRMYEWQPFPDKPFQISLQKQKQHVQHEFKQRLESTKLLFQEQGFNSDLYTNVLKERKVKDTVSLVPTSAHTGEGISDLLLLLVHLTQKFMGKKVAYSDTVACSVLELKMVDGMGLTIDVILQNGFLREGDTIVVCGMNGPIVTQIRALLTPQPMREIRVRGEYAKHKEVKAAMGIKIAANDLEGAVPGTQLLVVKPGDDLDDLKEEVMKDMSGVLSRTQSDKGVLVQASTLGALEALLTFLKTVDIPVSTVGVGPIHKKDIMRVVGMKERHPKFAVVLAFDVVITPEGQSMADKEGIRIFTADIIYNLEDKFRAYLDEHRMKLQEKNKLVAVFPCHLKLWDGKVINKKSPIILGMTVARGQLRPGTPIFTMKAPEEGKRKQPFLVGTVESVELDHKEQKVYRGDKAVAVKIKPKEESITFGRHIDEHDEYYSMISRESIDALKESFREDMVADDWQLIIDLKKVLAIL